MDVIKRYKNIDLFQGVSHESVDYVLERCPVRTLSAGEILLSPDQDNQSIYLVLSGSLGVHLESPNKPAVALIRAGGCAGEMSIIDANPPSAWVVAESDSDIMIVDQKSVWSLVYASHRVSCNLLNILSRRMRYNNELIVEGQKRQRLLENFARVDALTGLFNRRWLDETLMRQIKRGDDNDRALCVILIDADHFKNYNDTHGHLAGDCALISLGHVLSDHLRPADIAARYGGEEFAVILPDTEMDVALTIAERLRFQIEKKEIKSSDGILLPHITISAGVAQFKKGQSAEQLLESADKGLYKAKNSGRNRVCVG
ncbi:MAG: GGDEF domain-containing protein [Magnetococcales bacterium]|nr:GGDEF domain-containing protein [Magnetococcales bacterium]